MTPIKALYLKALKNQSHKGLHRNGVYYLKNQNLAPITLGFGFFVGYIKDYECYRFLFLTLFSISNNQITLRPIKMAITTNNQPLRSIGMPNPKLPNALMLA